MSNNLEAALNSIDCLLTPSVRQHEEYLARAKTVTDQLFRNSSTKSCQLIGSVARSTALRGISDVDLLAVMAKQGEKFGPPGPLLTELESAILATGTRMHAGRIAITIEFSNPPNVDVMPAIQLTNTKSFLIPDATGTSWSGFEPEHLSNLVKESVDRLGFRFLSLVRMVKYWSHSRGAGLKSSDLEELVCIAFADAKTITRFTDAILRAVSIIDEWIDGNTEVAGKMGRPFTADGPNERAAAITKSSLHLAEIMSLPSAQGSVTLLKEFFGGGHAENVK